jgi:hypothetical protein
MATVFARIVQQPSVAAAAAVKPRVVLTFSLYPREARDFVRAGLRGTTKVMLTKLNCDTVTQTYCTLGSELLRAKHST